MLLRSRIIATVVMAGVFTGTCLASSIGSVGGYAKDPTGASLPGVQIVLTNTATAEKITKTSGSDGGFQFPQLAPGTYSIEATLNGFKRDDVKQVVV